MAHYTYFENDRNQDINNTFFDDQNGAIDQIDFTTLSNQQIRIYSGQIDYSSKIVSNGRFESGIKYVGIDSNSALFQNGLEPIMSAITTSDGSFEYDESTLAGYFDVDVNWKKTKLSLGLRAEYTESKGHQPQTDTTFKNDYLEWFPNFSIRHDLGHDKNLLLYYYRRITRPRYEQINPFQLFQGFNSTVEGNPRLLPATRHYLAAGYDFNKWIGFELFYRYRLNQLRLLTFQDNTNNLVRFVNSNVKRELGYGLDIIFNKKILLTN